MGSGGRQPACVTTDREAWVRGSQVAATPPYLLWLHFANDTVMTFHKEKEQIKVILLFPISHPDDLFLLCFVRGSAVLSCRVRAGKPPFGTLWLLGFLPGHGDVCPGSTWPSSPSCPWGREPRLPVTFLDLLQQREWSLPHTCPGFSN